MEPRQRSEHGQASAEYVALVALVAVALALAAGLTSGGVGGQVLAGLQRGLCRVALGHCPRPEPPRPDLAPCPVERRARAEELGTTIAVVRLGTSGTLTAVRLSDGRVTVTLAHGNDAGAEVGVAARLRVGRRSLGGELRAGAALTWTSGRSWTFASEAGARRFVDTYGSKATIGGQLVDGVRSRCSLLCDAIGWNPHAELPEPDERFSEGGLSGRLTASFGLGRASLESGALLGRRLRPDGSKTWYLQLDAAATAGLGLGAGELEAAASRQAVLAVELDPRGRPRTLGVTLSGELGADATLHAAAGAQLRAGGAAVVELEATLDLREPANRDAAAELLGALTDPRALPALPERVRALRERIARHGQLDRRIYAMRRSAAGLGAGVGLGAKLGAGFDRTTSDLRLLEAETRLPGLPFLPRDDCRVA
jgi:hypothetical protein